MELSQNLKNQVPEAPEDIQEEICFDNSNNLYICMSIEKSFLTKEYLHRLKLLKINCKITYLPIDQFRLKQKEIRSLGKISTTDAEELAADLLQDAKQNSASDIHIRVITRKSKTEILYRIHGEMVKAKEGDDSLGANLCAIYGGIMPDPDVKSKTNFTPKQQFSGRIGHHPSLPKGLVGVRVENIPTNTGNKMTLRLLYDGVTGDKSLSSLGFYKGHDSVFKMFRKTSHGLILISGPTGSGKSTTLNRYLSEYMGEHRGTRSVYTIEDPVELPLEGADQTEIPYCKTPEERSDAFTTLLSSALRSDPDVVMSGEIRDKPSATLSMQAAMTGHQVLSTIHANNALGSLSRLVDLGVPEELAYDSGNVIGLVSQRLVKRLCDHCKKPFKDSESDFTEADYSRILKSRIDITKTYVKGPGCEHCNNKGVTSRTVVAQVIRTDMTLMKHLRNHDIVSAAAHIKDHVKSINMTEHAIMKIENGEIDPFDAESVLGLLNMHILESDAKIEMSEIEGSVS